MNINRLYELIIKLKLQIRLERSYFPLKLFSVFKLKTFNKKMSKLLPFIISYK